MSMAYQTFTHQIWWVMVCYDLAHQIRLAKHTFSGRCDIAHIVCCSFGGHSTPQFLQCGGEHLQCGVTMRPIKSFSSKILILSAKARYTVAWVLYEPRAACKTVVSHMTLKDALDTITLELTHRMASFLS